MEQWKQIIIDGEEWNYEVCNLDGKVRNTKTGRILKQAKNSKDRYFVVVLSKDGKQKQFYVHRIVAEAFIPKIENKPYVNHKDENKHNNSADNLEWCTHQENITHGTCQQRKSEKLKDKKPVNRKKVRCIETGQVFDSIVEAATWLGLSYKGAVGNIGACCKGTWKTAYGYSWEYVD